MTDALNGTVPHGISQRMGRTKLWHEAVNLRLAKGAKSRMDAVLEDGEDRLDLIRDAIDKEVKRREMRRSDKAALAGRKG